MQQYVTIKLGSAWEPSLGDNVRSAAPDGYVDGTVYINTSKLLPEISHTEIMDIVAGLTPVGYSNQGDAVYAINDQTAADLAKQNDDRANAKKAQAEAEHAAFMARVGDPVYQAEQAERRRKADAYDRAINEGGYGYNPYRD